MRPRPLHTRNDLIDLVAPHAPTQACSRAIREGRSTVLGGFTPPEGLPYWLVAVTSRFGRQWLIAVVCDENENRFRIEYPSAVRWDHWDGRSDGRDLRDGDNPTWYALQRAKAKRNVRRTPNTTEAR